MAATSPDNHVTIFLEDDVRTIVEVEYGDGGELGGCTARLWHGERLHEVSQGLYNSVVSGVHLGVKRKCTFTVAVERSVAFRSNDPILQQRQPELRRKKRVGEGARAPPPPPKKSEKIFSGNYHVKFWHFFGKILKFRNFVNLSGKCHNNSGILIIFRANIT